MRIITDENYEELIGMINKWESMYKAAQVRITRLETVCCAAEKELRIASELPDLSPRNRVEFSNAANMLFAVLQDTTP